MAEGKPAKSSSDSETRVGRRQALARLGLGAAAIYAAPSVLSLSEAHAGSGGGSGGSGGGDAGTGGSEGEGTGGASSTSGPASPRSA